MNSNNDPIDDEDATRRGKVESSLLVDSTSRAITSRDIKMATRAGWRIVDEHVPISTSDMHVVQCYGDYGQQHFGIVKDLSTPCLICKLLNVTGERQCVQHIYLEGRCTFEFICVRGHHYLASSYKKNLSRCPMCTIEDSSKELGRRIIFDSVCVYVNQDSLLRYWCAWCNAEHYITYGRWMQLFKSRGKKRTTFKSVIDWCQTERHRIPDRKYNLIISTMRIFDQLFDVRFDDCDDMNAADGRFLSGIYFTGFNRAIRVAFVHVLDSCYRENNTPLLDWCKLANIHLIIVNTHIHNGYEAVLMHICEQIATLQIPTRFDRLIDGPPEGVPSELHRATRIVALMMAEGKRTMKHRMINIR